VDESAAESASEPPTRRARRPRRRVSIAGVLGELLITAGVIVLLYVGWQLWIGDMIFGAQRNALGQDLSQQWEQEYSAPVGRSSSALPTASPAVSPDATPDATATPAPVEPVILPEAADGETFAVMRIPRFGPDYAWQVAGGVTRERTLDPIGIGHYPGTPMPGAVGNFAVAAPRTTWGAPFNRIAELHVDDAIVVETADGWYTYRFRTLEYVEPTEVGVLLPVPQVPDAPAGSRFITMTSCSPMYAMTERIVAYGVFESFTPRASGPPASLTEGVSA
jgi:sortase A